jgi:threonine dehydrogenase-like Zn-dependent dehydrogenase
MSADARAFWVVAPSRGELRPAALPSRGEGDVEVEALYSAVSRGTELLVFGGHVPASEHARMRAPFQDGDFALPVKYGYASVGRVVAGPPALRGRAVFCLYPHQDRYVVPAAAVCPLPGDVPPARAVLAANLETALNALWDAGAQPGDRISVVGGGVVGGLVAYLAARIPGCAVELVDLRPERAALAAALGVGFAAPARATGERDVVFHASGAPAGLVTALGLAGDEARVVELSWYGDRAVALPLGEAFHARRLTLQSSQVGRLPAARRARWDHRRRLELALSLLADPALDALFSGEVELVDLPAAMAGLGASAHLALRVRYGGPPA